ncbi:matrixin family metalloprotease [Micromonospora sp. NBC_01412]|uniref:matrixin family metalloprotease n=1 Tax=Micromonospora sp. NBC_01412 TaxID=2903590 RepID=UPI00324C0649
MTTVSTIPRGLFRAAAIVASAALASTATLAMTAGPASAYALHGCKVSSTTVQWTDGTGGGAYGTAAQSSASAWQATSTPLLFSKVASGGHVGINIANYGNVSFDGITQKISGGDPVCGGGGTWTTKLTATWNTYHANAYSAAKKQSVMAHELGHVLGIAHSGIGPCISVPLAYPTTDIRYDSCLINTPKADDIAAANFIY